MWADLVGRSSEREAVCGFLDDLEDGPCALFLEGEPGLGKTSLWLAAMDTARSRGFRTLVARPSAAEAQLSYSCLADLLSELAEPTLQLLPTPQRRALDAALLRSDTADQPIDGRAIGAAVLTLLERFAELQPVLVGLDDLQWVDASSRAAITFALRRAGSRVGLVATLRSEGMDASTAMTLPAPGRTVRVTLGPLRPAELHQVLRERTGRPWSRPSLHRLHEISGGNPFYALELARSLSLDEAGSGRTPPVPGSLGQLVRERVECLPPDVQEFVLAAATLAEPTIERLQRAVRSESQAEAEELLQRAERADILRVDGARISFTQPVLASAVSSSATPGDVRALHRRLAQIVDDPEERARHLALAAVRADHDTVKALDEAATRASSRGAPATAAELLELAVGLGATAPERRLRAAQHHVDAGDVQRARTSVEHLVSTLPRGVLRAEALTLLATIRLHGDSFLEASEDLERALDEAGGDLRLRVRILVELMFVLVNLGRIADGLLLVDATVTAAERLGEPDLLAQALATGVMIGFLSGRGLDSATLERALDLEDVETSAPVMLRPSLINALLLGWTGRLDEARDHLLAIRQRCLDHGQESDLMFTAFHTVIVECWRGDLVQARLVAEDTMERALQLGTDIPLAIALTTEANVCAHTGHADEARAAALRALQILQRGTCLAATVWPLVTLGFIDVSLGEYAGAAVTLGPLAAAAAAMGYGEPAAAPFAGDAIEALIEVGRVDEASRLLDELEANGRRLDRPWALALAARGRALLLAAGGDLEGAAESARAALVEHERLAMPFERARTLLVMGQVQRRQRQKRAAAATMREALDVFEALGMPLWSARANRELQRVAVSGRTESALTPSEQRVAQLAVTGLRNREMATALFISPKTVEANLARIYHKLGIHSRAELGSRMADLGTWGNT